MSMLRDLFEHIRTTFLASLEEVEGSATSLDEQTDPENKRLEEQEDVQRALLAAQFPF